MAKDFYLEKRPHSGLTYEEYIQNTENYLDETDSTYLETEKKARHDIISLNLHRSKRIQKSYNPGEKITELIQSIDSRQIWMIITEDWCGDSAQNLPYIAEMAKLNPNINLRILLRDDNLDIIDFYLTNGTSRSIPILVAFDKQGNELFKWGPRPETARQNVEDWKNEGLEKKEFMEKLHLWYARNKGQDIENEFVDILSKLTLAEPINFG